MIHVNGENVDDERASIDGNNVIINYGQNIETVKLFGSYDLSELESEPEIKNNNDSPYTTLMKYETAPIPEGFVSYVSEELGFSINHPESWKVQTNWPDDGFPPTIVISVNGETSTENYDTSLIIISAEPFSDELESMDEYVKLISENIDKQPQSDLFKATKGYVEFVGVEAFLVESEINNYGSEIRILWYTVDNNEMLYTILYKSSQSTYESNKELRDEFLSSFRLIP